MGAVTLPEMRKYKYNDRLSTGSIVGGANLGPLIPPSMPFIIYGLLTMMAIGELFIAGIIPGLLLSAVFILIVYAWCRLNPKAGPVGEKATWGQRFASLKTVWPMVVLFVLVIGGIYAGIFTPCEGGGVGAFGAFCIGLFMKRFTWQNFTQSLLDAAKVISMVFLLINGATLFGQLAAWCNLSGTMTDLIAGLGLTPTSVVLLILIIFFILGFVIDSATLLLIGVPILHPAVVASGVDPLWFAVLAVVTIGVGTITPPVGINLFALKGVAKDISISTIYWGAIPFVVGTVIVIGLIFAIPPLATWLPSVLR
jgi:tripartite ATP-independent transporter DctM subunit